MAKRMKIRTLLLGVVFTLLFGGLIGRLYYVQVVEASELLNKAEAVWSQNRILPATRGTIFDRNDKVLAQDGAAYTVVVYPQIINNYGQEQEIINALASPLGLDDAEGRLKLSSLITRKRDNGEFYTQVEIRSEGWKVDSEIAELIADELEQNNLRGVRLLEEQKRYYPVKELASHVLGYTNKDGEAVYGLESYYDKLLKGQSGMIRYEKDGKSFELPDSKVIYEPAVNGYSIQLTIDENIQMYIEQALEKTFVEYNPKSITAVAVDPQTMEILGMGNYPNFNPNEYWDVDHYGVFHNDAIASQHEPGSTFKIVTLAAAIEEGYFNPNDTYMSGTINITGHTIRDHQSQGWGEITYLEGLKRSSNVAFVKLGYEMMGATKLRKYIDDFGFGVKTGIDLPGEINGEVSFRDSVPTEIATATFGQGRVAVSAIQQVSAISAIANGGNLMQPYIVKEIRDSDTEEIIQKTDPTVIRRVISEHSSKVVGEYLEHVISDQTIGSGRLAYIDGFRLAGKTGTAQKVIDGKYAQDKWVVSFIGYAPVEDPQIALIVIIDEPEMHGDYRLSSRIVSPVFKEIMEKSLLYMGASSHEQAKESFVTISSANSSVPDVNGMSLFGADNELRKLGLNPTILGRGKTIIDQFPLKDSPAARDQSVYLLTENPELIAVPEMTGMSLRDAFQLCGLLQITCEVLGEGYVTDQALNVIDGQRHLRLSLQPLRKLKLEDQQN